MSFDGPSTKIRGLARPASAASAARVSGGMSSLDTNRTGSPVLATYAAAGIANEGSSELAMMIFEATPGWAERIRPAIERICSSGVVPWTSVDL